MKTPHLLSLPILALAALAVGGCIESESVYHLNPDGSGKVHHRLKFTKTMGNWTSENPARDLALGFVRGAGGIEAWDDVHYRMAGGNAVEFRGIAYFRDVNQVSLGTTISEGEPQQLPLPRLEFKDNGKLTLKDATAKGDSSAAMKITVNGNEVPLDEEDPGGIGEIDMGGIGGAFATALTLQSDIKTTVRVAGTIADANGFAVETDGDIASASFHYHPDLDEDAVKERLGKKRKTKQKEKLSEDEVEKIFKGGIFENKPLLDAAAGVTPPVSASLSIERPSFDYESEVAEADFPVTPDESEGWTKLESLDP